MDFDAKNLNSSIIFLSASNYMYSGPRAPQYTYNFIYLLCDSLMDHKIL